MRLFDWLWGKNPPPQVTDEVALAQATARIRRYAESAQIKFIHYFASDKFIYDNPLDNLTLDEFSKEVSRLRKV